MSADPQVRALTADDEAGWTAFVTRHPGATLYHTLDWRDFVRSVFGHEPRYLVAVAGGHIVGVLPLFLIRAPLLGRKLISLPYDMGSGGPLTDDADAEIALARGASDEAQGARCRFLQFRGDRPRASLETLGFLKSEPLLISETALPDGAAVWQRVAPDARQSMRKAERRGLHVREAAGRDDVEAFYRVYLRVFRDFGTPPYGPTYFPTVYALLGPTGLVRLFLAAQEERVVGGLLIFAWQRQWVSKFAVCLPEAVNDRAYAVLYGAALEAAVQDGVRTLNWGTSARHQTGLLSFKERWAATSRPAILHSLAFRGTVPSVERYYDESGLSRRVWRRLPLSLTASMGGVLNRWFC